MTKIMGKALANPVVPVPPEVTDVTGTSVYALCSVIFPDTVKRWKFALFAASCKIIVSLVFNKAKKMSMSTESELIWLMLSCVALVCVALFQMMSPDPGSPDVLPVSAR
jgi:hypothetical protein